MNSMTIKNVYTSRYLATRLLGFAGCLLLAACAGEVAQEADIGQSSSPLVADRYRRIRGQTGDFNGDRFADYADHTIANGMTSIHANLTNGTLAVTEAKLAGNSSSTFTGNIAVERGALSLQNAGAIGTATAVVSTASGGLLNLNTQSVQIAGLIDGSTVGGSVGNLGTGSSGSTSNLTFRGADSYRLNLTPEQEEKLDRDLQHPGEYNTLSNNCGDPVESSLEQMGASLGVNITPRGLRSAMQSAGTEPTTVRSRRWVVGPPPSSPSARRPSSTARRCRPLPAPPPSAWSASRASRG